VEPEEERSESAHEEQVEEIWRQASNPHLSHGVTIKNSSSVRLESALQTTVRYRKSKAYCSQSGHGSQTTPASRVSEVEACDGHWVCVESSVKTCSCDWEEAATEAWRITMARDAPICDTDPPRWLILAQLVALCRIGPALVLATTLPDNFDDLTDLIDADYV
jgi:hypothetical protein